MHETALKSVIDLLGGQAVADHIIGTKQSEQVRVATILAVNAGGTLNAQDIATVQSLAEP